MFEWIRENLKGPAGKAIAVIIAIVALGLMYVSFRANFGGSDAAQSSATRNFIDSKTNQPFAHTLKAGETLPLDAPSGGKTGYPAELCYWTKDGKIKTEPTAVLLQQTLGKPGPTFCPDCGRLVVLHNPAPQPGDKPPPTAAEYKLRRRPGADDER